MVDGPAEENDETPPPVVTSRHRQAAALLGLECLALLGYAIYIVVDSLSRSRPSQVVAEALTLGALVLFGALVARGLRKANGFARTPALMWHFILLMCGIWIAQVGQPLIGIVLALAGILGLVTTFRLPPAEL